LRIGVAWTIGVAIALAGIAAAGLLGQPGSPEAGEAFEITAYCVRGTTKSGARVRGGMAAADPRVLPLGSVIRIEGSGDWDGIYTVMDTGAAVRGRIVDVHVRDCEEALELGRREARVSVIRRGWEPGASEPDDRTGGDRSSR